MILGNEFVFFVLKKKENIKIFHVFPQEKRHFIRKRTIERDNLSAPNIDHNCAIQRI